MAGQRPTTGVPRNTALTRGSPNATPSRCGEDHGSVPVPVHRGTHSLFSRVILQPSQAARTLTVAAETGGDPHKCILRGLLFRMTNRLPKRIVNFHSNVYRCAASVISLSMIVLIVSSAAARFYLCINRIRRLCTLSGPTVFLSCCGLGFILSNTSASALKRQKVHSRNIYQALRTCVLSTFPQTLVFIDDRQQSFRAYSL